VEGAGFKRKGRGQSGLEIEPDKFFKTSLPVNQEARRLIQYQKAGAFKKNRR
jgi:hypothetical protein